MKVVIIGSRSFVGFHLAKSLRRLGHLVLETDYKKTPNTFLLDLCCPSIENIPIKGFDYAIITAGMTNIKACEKNPKLSYQCNVTGTLTLANKLQQIGVCPVLFSSDCIFDGSCGEYLEESPPTPINHYSKQKTALERSLPSNYILLRSSKIYSLTKGDNTLLDEIANQLLHGKKVRAAVDQIFSPIYIDDLISIIHLLLIKNIRGTFNLAGKESISRYALATSLSMRILGHTQLIEPISIDELNENFKRSKNTTLDTNKLYETIAYNPLQIDKALDSVAEMYRSLFSEQR